MRAYTGEIALPFPDQATPRKRREVVVGLAVAAFVAAVTLSSATAERGDAHVRAAVAASPTATDPAPDFLDFGMRASHNGRYRAMVVSPRTLPGVGATHSWTISIIQRDHRPLAHGRVTVDTWMPETGERSSARPTAHYVGSGRYRIDNIHFSRPGWWNVALVIDGFGGTDSLAFNVRWH